MKATAFWYVPSRQRCARQRPNVALSVALIFTLGVIERQPAAAPFSDHRNWGLLAERSLPPIVPSITPQRAGEALTRTPLRFEICDERAPGRFVARGNGWSTYLAANEAVLFSAASEGVGRLGRGADLGSPRNAESPQANEQLPGPRRDRAAPRFSRSRPSVRLQFIGARRNARVLGETLSATLTSYFIGRDPSRWRAGVANYERVRIEQAYPGIDVIYYGSGHNLEYDFNLAPGANPRAIRLRFKGASRVEIDNSGSLSITAAAGRFFQHAPAAYQIVDGQRCAVNVGYRVLGRNDVALVLGDYNRALPLVVDPVLSYATYFGSRSGFYSIKSVAFDADGNAYIVGETSATDLPTTPGSFQPQAQGLDAFVAKLNAAGSALVYATYLGGSGSDAAGAIAVDSSGNAFVSGATASADFPTTANAFQPGPFSDIPHAFVTKLNPGGTALVYSTYLGNKRESSSASGIAVDSGGLATVAGFTGKHFPVTAGALQSRYGGGERDAFVARLNRDGSALEYATYLGGDGSDSVTSVAMDKEGNAYVIGDTMSNDFPITRNAYQGQKPGNDASFIAKVGAGGDRLVYSTYFGTAAVSLHGIAVDLGGNAYITGAGFSPNVPTTADALQTVSAGDYDAFVAKLNERGSALIYSTFLGGRGFDNALGISVDPLGQAYVTGNTQSPDFPLRQPFQAKKSGGPLFKTTDGGGSWEDIPATPTGISSLVVDPQSPSTLYSSAFGDVLKSTDAGATWTVISTIASTTSLAIDSLHPATLYRYGFFGIDKSVNAGVDWQRLVSFAQGNIFTFVSTLVIDPTAPDTLYYGLGPIAVPDRSSTAGTADILSDKIFKSTDGGGTWRPLLLPRTVNSIGALAIDPHSPATVYAATGAEVLKSTNRGATWLVLPGTATLGIARLAIDPASSNTLYGIAFNGILKSTDGAETWSRTGLENAFPSLLAIDPRMPGTVYAAGSRGIQKTSDGGATWRSVLEGINGNAIAIDPQDNGIVYVGTFATSDMFVARLNPAGGALSYSTYLGGSRPDTGVGIAADAYGNAYIAGTSSSTDFPVTRDVYQSTGPGTIIGVVVRIADATPPHIASATVKGKNLAVAGEGFDRGAVITVDGADFETANDVDTPSALLISRRGGKQIPRGQTVSLRVRNASSQLSNSFPFTRPSN